MTSNITTAGRASLSDKANAQKQPDGKFGHLQKDAPVTGLPAAPVHDYDAIAAQASTDVSNLWEGRSAFHNLESAAAARCMAAVVRKELPDAETIRMVIDRNSHSWEVLSVSGASTGVVDFDDLDASGVDEFLDATNSLNIDPYDSATSPYMDVEVNHDGGHIAVMRIDDALKPSEPVNAGPGEQGATILTQYSALASQAGRPREEAAVSLLADLDGWAKANGQDLADLLARAQQVRG